MDASQVTSLSLEDSNYVMVAAIDFGTTFSGYAFSFRNHPTAIRMNKSWGEAVGFQAYKTPSCVLIKSDGNFEAFGYEAEDRYAEVDEDGCKSEVYHLYKHFKMMLHREKKLTRKSTICSVNGHISPAMDIFAMAIKYLKDHLLSTVRKQVTSVDESLIRWVITVPAIWREEAKQFMREAALQAGLISTKDSKSLLICLEPEAASILCRNTEMNQFEETSNASFETDTKYLMVDAGGGTIDITIHQVLPSGNVKELHRATGGEWGGTKVDDNFVRLTEDVFGKKFIADFKTEYPRQWYRFMVNFERLKKGVKPDGRSKICIDIPWSLSDMYRSKHNKGVDQQIKQKASLGVGFGNGVFIIKAEAVNRLFQPVMDEIVMHLKDLIESNTFGCEYLLLVGGFAESKFLQGAINAVCDNIMKLLVPPDTQMAVIKGAVLFGHNPICIESRIARKTYGSKVIQVFDEYDHDEEFAFSGKDGQKYVSIFEKFISMNDEVDIGTKIETYSTPMYADQKEMEYIFLCVDRPFVTYYKEEGVQNIGSFTVRMPNTEDGVNREVLAEIIFGGTEIQVEATDLTSGCSTKTTIDFLSN